MLKLFLLMSIVIAFQSCKSTETNRLTNDDIVREGKASQLTPVELTCDLGPIRSNKYVLSVVLNPENLSLLSSLTMKESYPGLILRKLSEANDGKYVEERIKDFNTIANCLKKHNALEHL